MSVGNTVRTGVAAGLLAVAGLTVALGASPPAAAQQVVAGPQNSVTLTMGEGRLFRLDADASNVFVGDSAVADAQPAGPRMVYVYGRKAGTTTVTAATQNGSVGTLNVRVVRNPGALVPSAAVLSGPIPGGPSPSAGVPGTMSPAGRPAAYGGPVSLSFAGNRLVVSGRVAGPGEALGALAAADAANPGAQPPLDRTELMSTRQITLRVRIAEVSRTALNTLGINWGLAVSDGSFGLTLLTGGFLAGGGNILSGINPAQNFGLGGPSVSAGHVNANALVNALQRERVLSLLAEPNLTTVSGRTARFLAGGEVPVPVPQSLGTTTIEYKPYGVSLAFTPTLLPGNRIGLDVHPEVSELDPSNGVVIDGITVPAFTTRSADTAVEMASGQTVAIAGLFTRNISNQLDRYPFLGDIPVIGALFRSRTYQRGETELVILITPYLSEPMSAPDAVPLPTDSVSRRSSLLQSAAAGGFVVN